jgi:hypothetical protein
MAALARYCVRATPKIDSAHVVRGVSESLRTLIRTHISELAAEDAVVFDSPAHLDAQGGNKLSLFLYQLEINPFLRNVPATLNLGKTGVPNPASVEKIPPPLAVDLVYMMVPYAKSAEIELVIVDKLVRLFYNFQQLLKQYLHPVLAQTGNELLEIIADTSSIDTLRHIWSGFPHRAYKLTKLYTVTPVRIPADKPEVVDMVTITGTTVEELP